MAWKEMYVLYDIGSRMGFAKAGLYDYEVAFAMTTFRASGMDDVYMAISHWRHVR